MTATSREITSPDTDPRTAPDPWATRGLLDLLDAGERSCRGCALQWTEWAGELAALQARIPDTPALLDPDGVDAIAITRAAHYDPAAIRADLAGPLAAADHLAAVYTRHAGRLADAVADVLEDAYPPPEPTMTSNTSSDPGSDLDAGPFGAGSAW